MAAMATYLAFEELITPIWEASEHLRGPGPAKTQQIRPHLRVLSFLPLPPLLAPSPTTYTHIYKHRSSQAVFPQTPISSSTIFTIKLQPRSPYGTVSALILTFYLNRLATLKRQIPPPPLSQYKWKTSNYRIFQTTKIICMPITSFKYSSANYLRGGGHILPVLGAGT